jgi:hypothetical protein
VFDVPMADVSDVVWPWCCFGGGVKLRAAAEPYRLSFVLPDGAEYRAAAIGRAAARRRRASRDGPTRYLDLSTAPQEPVLAPV